MTQRKKRHTSASSNLPAGAILLGAGQIIPQAQTATDDVINFNGTPEQAELHFKEKVASLLTMAIVQMTEQNTP